MNRRLDRASDNNIRIVIGVVVLAIVLAAVYFLVIKDDDDTKKKSGGTTNLPVQTYTAPGQSFTFQYPGNFAQSTPPDDGTVWIAGVGPYDLLRVKRIANKPTSPGRLKNELSRTLGAAPGSAIVAQGQETRSGLDVVTFTVTSTVDGKDLSSRLFFFSANGVTWQFECESQAKAAAINAGCEQALSTFSAVS